jgi:hypothetical protein
MRAEAMCKFGGTTIEVPALFVYVTAPIDFWDGWTREGRYVKELAARDYYSPKAVAEYKALMSVAMELARGLGWDGDIREGPYVTALPNPDSGCSDIIVAWKQDNNGTTFIASPRLLPWLHDA